jgi:hypothetical protein
MSVVSARTGGASVLGGLTADVVTDPNALERRIGLMKAALSDSGAAVGSAAARARRAREVAAIRAVLVDSCSAWATHLMAVGRFEAAVRENVHALLRRPSHLSPPTTSPVPACACS